MVIPFDSVLDLILEVAGYMYMFFYSLGRIAFMTIGEVLENGVPQIVSPFDTSLVWDFTQFSNGFTAALSSVLNTVLSWFHLTDFYVLEGFLILPVAFFVVLMLVRWWVLIYNALGDA